jgi:hypothetical protein
MQPTKQKNRPYGRLLADQNFIGYYASSYAGRVPSNPIARHAAMLANAPTNSRGTISTSIAKSGAWSGITATASSNFPVLLSCIASVSLLIFASYNMVRVSKVARKRRRRGRKSSM